MNKKVLIGGAAIVGIAVVVCAWYYLSVRAQAAKWSGPMKEIVEESITHENEVTRARFVSLIDGPIADVQKAVWDVENSQQMVANIKLSKLLESQGNTKLLEINLQALNLPLQAYTMQFVLHPEDHRVTFKTVKSQTQDIEGEYKLEASPDGTKTRLTYVSTARDKVKVPFPQSVLDSANRETYVNTVRGLQKLVKMPAAG